MLTVDAFPECRVFIREMSRDDVDAMAGWPRFREPELQWANITLFTKRDRDVYFVHGGSNETRRRFVIVDRMNQIVGTVGLRNLDFRSGEGTLGIIVRADAVGRGYGTDAIRNLLHFAFETLGFRRVLLDVADNNPRARRCYERLGFSEIGRRLGFGGVTFVDMVIYRQTFDLGERRLSERRIQREPVGAGVRT
jgi:RimJ/RimL family protein N-acetyltransferase